MLSDDVNFEAVINKSLLIVTLITTAAELPIS